MSSICFKFYSDIEERKLRAIMKKLEYIIDNSKNIIAHSSTFLCRENICVGSNKEDFSDKIIYDGDDMDSDNLFVAFCFDYSFHSSREVLMFFSRLICAAGDDYEKLVYFKNELLWVSCNNSLHYNYIFDSRLIAKMCLPGGGTDFYTAMSSGYLKFSILYQMVALCINYGREMNDAVMGVRKHIGEKNFEKMLGNLLRSATSHSYDISDVDDEGLKECFDLPVDDLAEKLQQTECSFKFYYNFNVHMPEENEATKNMYSRFYEDFVSKIGERGFIGSDLFGMKIDKGRTLFIYAYAGNYNENVQLTFWTPFVIVFKYDMRSAASIFRKDMMTLFGNGENSDRIKKICDEIAEKCLRMRI